MSSGTAALHTALIYLNCDPGDEILVSPITDMGAVIPILYQQAVPVFVDVDPLNQNMHPDGVRSMGSEVNDLAEPGNIVVHSKTLLNAATSA